MEYSKSPSHKALFLTAVNPHLELSTNVSISKLTRKRALLPKLNQSYSVSSSSEATQTNHSTRWDAFLKRNFGAIDLRRSASQEALEAVREQAEKEYDRRRMFPRSLLNKIRRVEGKTVVQPAITALDMQLLNMQKLHNRLHHEVVQKQSYLLLLSSELLPNAPEVSEKNEKLLQDCAFTSTLAALEREEKTEATLMHIIDREKAAVQIFGLPVAEMQEEIDRLSRQIQDATFRSQRNETKRQFYESEAVKWEEQLRSMQKRRAEGVSRLLQSYSDQQLLLTHFQREEEAKRQVVTEKAKAQSLLALEYELELKLEFNKKAEKLKRIEAQNLGKVDLFKGASDTYEGTYVYMVNYWMHLNTNSKHLEESSEQLLKEIESRNQERESLKQTLVGVLESQDNGESTQQIAHMEELLSFRARDVESKEVSLAPLQRLEIVALNSLSRVVYKVSDVMHVYSAITQVDEQVEFCAQSLEKMLEEIIKANNLQERVTC